MNSIRFKIIAGKINKIPEFYTIFARKNPDYIQNCLARTVVKAPKSSHITPILRSLHWLKINERIEYKLLSPTYKVLTTSQPDYLLNLISVHSTGRTRSSSLVTLARPSVSFSLQVTNRSFTCITLPVESAPFFIPSASFCSL